jgi:5'-3' exonuclease
MIDNNNNLPVNEITQLSYVLPKKSLKLLPKKIHEKLMKTMDDKYPENCELEWSFCKYLWEAHPKLPSININKLEQLIT